ncbi:MAG: thiamine pyrophosphate-binding protein [Thermoleophilia bacterium]|nr:thiamine pyrophosphate-binding protein [Thermoleophilia bacterium]
MSANGNDLVWHRVLDLDELPEGRVKTVVAGHMTLAMTYHEGAYGALDNHCPHQGGPLGEGSIEKGLLRCPWHGYDYDPLTGSPPPPFGDAPTCFEVEVRDDGIYVGLPPAPPRARTVSDVMVETMVNWGVTHVFGMVGHSNLGLADAMHEAEKRGDLTYVGIRHEGAAAFAASAYGKLTGRPGGCFAIAGPGSTNLLTGLYDAKVDRAPVLALSGQVPSKVRGRGAFQDVDLRGAFADVALYSETVQANSNHAELMNMACKHATIERQVGHLVFPDEVQVIEVAEGASAGSPAGRVPNMEIAPPEQELARAATMIAEAQRPAIIVGYGSRFDMDHITAFAERLGAPVMTTFKGKGLIPDRHALGCGVLGRSGTPIASYFMNESDLLIVFGASFSDHTGISDYKPTIQVDYEPFAQGRFHSVTIPLLGHVGVTARALVAALPDAIACANRTALVAERWEIWRNEKSRRLEDDFGEGVNSPAIFDAMNRHVPANAVIAVDVGNNTYSFGRYFESTGQSVLMSGYLGSIGFGYPAAMGAWAAAPGRPIWAVTGDGGFGQYMGELTTAVKHEMPIKHVLINNSQLGKISKEQRDAHFPVWQTALHNPSFAEYAENCGALGIRLTDRSELDSAMATLAQHAGPATLEVVADPALL